MGDGGHRVRPGGRRPAFVRDCDARSARLGPGFCQVCEALIPKADGTPHKGRTICGPECRAKLDRAWYEASDNWLRRQVYERDKTCRKCGQYGDEVDHIKALCLLTETEAQDVFWWGLGNLQLLCHDCHAKKTAEDVRLLKSKRISRAEDLLQ